MVKTVPLHYLDHDALRDGRDGRDSRGLPQAERKTREHKSSQTKCLTFARRCILTL